MSGLNEAADVKAPISGRIIRRPASSTHATFAIPEGWDGAKVDVTYVSEDGDAVDLVFGDSNVQCVFGQESGASLTISANTGLPVLHGSLHHFTMPTRDIATHFSFESDGSTGDIVIRKS